MIKGAEALAITQVKMANHPAELPDWGLPIVDFIAPRLLVDVNDIKCFPSNSRNNRKKLVQFAQNGFLKRYEITTDKKPIIAYSLGKEGMRASKMIVPNDINIIKAQELIIANKFTLANNIKDFRLSVSAGLLIGEVTKENTRLALWCPRQPESRIKSLKREIPLGVDGLMIIAPTLKMVYPLAGSLSDFKMPIYVAIDAALNRFMRLVDGALGPA